MNHLNRTNTLRLKCSIDVPNPRIDIQIPVNSTSIVNLPGATLGSTKESGIALAKSEWISNLAAKGKNLTLNVSSGSYHFTYNR